MDAVAHDVAHRAGIKVRPNRFGAMRLFGAGELFGDKIECVVPGDRGELAAPLGTDPAQRMLETVWMMHPLGITRDFGADDAGGVGVIFGAADATDRLVAVNLDLERAGRRTIVRTSRSGDTGADGLVHCARTLSRFFGCGEYLECCRRTGVADAGRRRLT